MHACCDEASTQWSAGQLIQGDIKNLASLALERQLSAVPKMREYFSGDRYDKSVDDTVYHLTALVQALLAEEPDILADYVTWTKIVLVSRGLKDEHLAGSLVAIRKTLGDALPDDLFDAAAAYIDAALETLALPVEELPPTAEVEAPLADAARAFLEALLDGDRDAAAGIVDEVIAAGVALPEIYEHVFVASQREIGRLWQTNRISVAIEHYATGATEAIMLQRCARESSKTAGDARRFLGACVEGEQHDLAIRMACDVLQSRGWDTFYLGASTPESALLEAIGRLRPTVVGLSTTSFFHIDMTRRVIKSIRDAYPDVKIVVGGAPFARINGLAEKVGADARGCDLLGLATQFELLIAQDRESAPARRPAFA